MSKICISSGHALHVRGASGLIDEVNEARRVVNRTAQFLENLGVEVEVIHDNVSKSQSANLNYLVKHTNAAFGGHADLAVSVHFNAYQDTEKCMGTECLYKTQDALAAQVASNISKASGLINRGAKLRNDLKFLNSTHAPAILAEICFVDSACDVEKHYEPNFDQLCSAFSAALVGSDVVEKPPLPPEKPPVEPPAAPLFEAKGPCSWFGGPEDDGVASDEGLAFIYNYEDAPYLFLPEQPPETTGLARRLDSDHVYYLACRWDYDVTPKTMLADGSRKAAVTAKGKTLLAWPADWGPNESTGRIADLSIALLEALGLETDDTVTVVYPAPAQSETV